MNSETAAWAINTAAFKPGWRVEAISMGNLVYVYLEIDTVDSSYPDADGICRKEITLTRVESFDPSQLDLNGVFYQILEAAREINTHEDREFLKIRQPDGSWYAPFHPHTPEGIAAWRQFELF
jgi:hypothetical protein